MNKSLAALALICAICVAPAKAADVGISVSIGEPGFYGQLNMGNAGRPPVIYSQPVLVEHRYHNLAPIYLRVPPGQAKNWRRYCDRYNACTRPVYFVRDDWYRNVYAPRYRESHGNPYPASDRRGNDDHDRNDRDHNDRDHDNNGHGNGYGNGNGR